MLKPINETKADIWNKRFQLRMDELNLSQRKFSALYKERFGTGSQSDVSRWMKIGVKDSRSKSLRKFPEFETMQNIAEILGVSVGYLTGETDFETYEMEKVSHYMGLSPSAIKATSAVTSGRAIPPFYKYPNSQINTALELILSNSCLVEYLQHICDLAKAMSQEHNTQIRFQRALNIIPEQYRDAAQALWYDPEEAAENGIESTDELCAFVQTLHEAAVEDMVQEDMVYANIEINAAKYALQESHIKMIDEILSEGNVQKLLPRYATKEEVAQILGTHTDKKE